MKLSQTGFFLNAGGKHSDRHRSPRRAELSWALVMETMRGVRFGFHAYRTVWQLLTKGWRIIRWETNSGLDGNTWLVCMRVIFKWRQRVCSHVALWGIEKATNSPNTSPETPEPFLCAYPSLSGVSFCFLKVNYTRCSKYSKLADIQNILVWQTLLFTAPYLNILQYLILWKWILMNMFALCTPKPLMLWRQYGWGH